MRTKATQACSVLCAALSLWQVEGQAQQPSVPSLEDLERQLEERKAAGKPKPAAVPGKASTSSRRPARAFVLLPGGEFRMGDIVGDGLPSERPVRTVALRAFSLSTAEVTRGEFAEFVRATGYRTDAERDTSSPGCDVFDTATGKFRGGAGYSWRDPGFQQTDLHPVVCVSWNDAQAYIEWRNRQTSRRFRLPTEAEWEYAARAGSTAAYPWGMNANLGCEHGNGADQTPWPGGGISKWKSRMECNDRAFYTAPVGSYEPNEFGLVDMIGNVWEWTADCWNETYEGVASDGSAWSLASCPKHVFRGGAWDDQPSALRVSIRNYWETSFRYAGLGFRIAEDK